jgi:bacillithiol biosynthesis deacetylase BshB1
MNETVDVLAFGAHPDDIELSCGGTVAKLVSLGYKVAIADITQGEMGTRGTKQLRLKEAASAAKILCVTYRRNLKIPDGGITTTDSNLKKVISLIRELRPRTLIIPHGLDRHPDHEHAHTLCKEAWFYAGLKKIRTSLNGKAQEAFRPDNYFEFLQWHHFQPSFIVDITDAFETKMSACRAYSSQFHNPKSKDPETKLSDPEFLKHVQTECAHFGHRIGVKYGEAFYSPLLIGVANPLTLLTRRK